MTTPLVPANVDLTDFDWMPFDFQRLFNSDTWALSNDAEKVAAITLWGKSWYQKPAGSLPSDDRILASTNISGMTTRWKRVREMALRGWVLCDDQRYYHPVVCEKALEAWLEKLARRISSGAGNANRWGTEFDPSAIESDVIQARRFLMALNPQSRLLTKKKPPRIPAGKKTHPSGNADGIQDGIPSGSQETRTRTENYQERESDAPAPDPDQSPTAAGRACLLLRQAGCVRVNPSHPDLLAALAEGVTPEVIRDTYAEFPDMDNPFAYAITTARKRHAKGAKQVSGGSNAAHQSGRPNSHKLSASERVQQAIAERQSRERREGDVIEGTFTAVNP